MLLIRVEESPITTEKPLIFFDSQRHIKFNELGTLAKQYAIVVKSFDTFVEKIELLIQNNLIKENQSIIEKR